MAPMHICWRNITAARNSFAVLSAACALQDITLHPVDVPSSDVTCYSLNSVTARKYKDEIRAADCITIAGGPYASACYKELARVVDYVVVGEGESILPFLLHKLENGDESPVPGVATSKGFIPPDRTIILDSYPPFSQTRGYIEISRGCPFNCGYCQTPHIFGNEMRHRSIDLIAEYAKRLPDARFVTPNAFAYGSDGRTPRFDRIEKLLQRIGTNIYFGTFPSEVRPEFVCDRALDLVNRYCSNRKLHFGAQSGSDRVLGMLRRGHHISDVIGAVELCRDHDLAPVVDFIVGLPFEEEQDQYLTLELIRWVVRYGNVHIHQFLPLPGTSLAGFSPVPLIDDIQRALGKLALRGKLTGSWCDHEIRFFRSPSNDIP
jgi:B12-binding domain/radical SAM domain protein